MARVELDIDTPLSPERVIGALTDFSEKRPELWPGIHPSLYEVHSVGSTWAEVKEGTKAPGMTVWAVERYDWSVPGTVTWTVKESSFSTPGSSVSARVRQGPGGGSRIHIVWNRSGVGLKARMMVGMIKLSGGRPVAALIRAGLDKMLESERRARPEIDPG
jgi:hypothetical protein